MKFELEPLPYPKDALVPHMSAETMSFHYEKHHQTYMNNLKNLLQGKPETPMKTGATCLITCDVWEHAYYIDYRNLRAKFVETWLGNLVNWDFASANFK